MIQLACLTDLAACSCPSPECSVVWLVNLQEEKQIAVMVIQMMDDLEINLMKIDLQQDSHFDQNAFLFNVIMVVLKSIMCYRKLVLSHSGAAGCCCDAETGYPAYLLLMK